MPWIANRGEAFAELYEPDHSTVCISITEPKREHARLKKGYVDILRVEFSDYDFKHANIESLDPACFFNPNKAARIARFARKHRDKNILVHCAAGISRSGGVVEALLEAFPEYEDRGWPRHANGLVKTFMKRALGLIPLGADPNEGVLGDSLFNPDDLSYAGEEK